MSTAIAALLVGTARQARVQREVPRLGSIGPLGYVDPCNGRGSTPGLMSCTLRQSDGEPCPSGWMNVGGGYCRGKL